MCSRLVSGMVAITSALAQVPGPVKGGNVFYANDYGALADAVKAVAKGAVLYVPSGVYAVSAQIAISGIDVQCQQGAVIQASSNVTPIALGTGAIIDGCVVDGGYRAGNKRDVMIITGSDIRASHLTIRNGGNQGIYCLNTTNLTIENNVIKGNHYHPIYCMDNSHGLTIRNNVIDDTGGAGNTVGIAVHTQTAGSTASDIMISNNRITQSADHTNNFCIEVGNFVRGLPPVDTPANVTTTGNHCNLGADGSGMVSYSVVNGGVISGNQLNANGHAFFEGVETVLNTNTTVSGNVEIGAGAATLSGGMDIDRGTNVTLIGNQLQGPIVLGVSSTFGGSTISGATVVNNNITVPPGVSLSRVNALIWLQANAQGAIIRNVLVSGNHLNGSGTAGATGISPEADTGTIDSITISGNTLTGVTRGIARGPEKGTLTNVSVSGNVCDATVTNCDYGWAAAGHPETISVMDLNQPWQLPGTLALNSSRVVAGSLGTGANGNTDLAGFLTLGTAGTIVQPWPSGHTYASGPVCTVSTYSGGADYFQVQASTSSLTITAHNGSAAAGSVIQYHCDFRVY